MLFPVFSVLWLSQRAEVAAEVSQGLWPLTCLHKYTSKQGKTTCTRMDKAAVEEPECITEPHASHKGGSVFFFFFCLCVFLYFLRFFYYGYKKTDKILKLLQNFWCVRCRPNIYVRQYG